MPKYNKLIRDKIPEIMEKQGLNYKTRVLNDDDYELEIKRKLSEEVNEYFDSEENHNSLEELADVLELLHSLSEIHGEDIYKVEEIRKQKALERGGFKEKIYLIEVEDS
ncbi:nucleoside triphosphate pyrophosphohydrolase [Piscibacillus salipiscarius]|uniref:Phosphoribosyl-ATP pyrophosphohydrolase n=1 Tax=Piscibacillus salipiscarius TaxID=299480 RepID=A0ABW5QAP9_9BACI|nr:nucleoside triphosphate pyrophosphohydrolase [Piscibacillus salipiscarius]